MTDPTLNPGPGWKGQRFYEAGLRDGRQQPTPGAPVPPTDDWLRRADSARFLLEPPASEVVGELVSHIRTMKAEREELARIAFDLLELIEPRWEYDWRGNATNAHPDDFALTVRARAAAEQLRGGGSDG